MPILTILTITTCIFGIYQKYMDKLAIWEKLISQGIFNLKKKIHNAN